MLPGLQHRIARLFSLLLAGSLLCGPIAVAASDIQVLGLFKDMVILKVGEVQHKLRVGETSPEGVKLIAADSDRAILEMEGVRQTYTLAIPQRAKFFGQQKTFAEARIWADKGMYQTTGSINGLPVNFLVDTGASFVAMNTVHAKRLGINYRYTGRRSAANTASGIVRTYLVRLASVKVGNIELHNVEGAVVEGQGPSTILLGMSFLKHVKMHRDGNLLQLQKRH